MSKWMMGGALVAALAVGTVATTRAMSRAPEVIAPQTTGMVRLDVPVGTCSGTLIAPTWVLTAQHCVRPMETLFGNSDLLEGVPKGVLEGDSGYLHSSMHKAVWDRTAARFLMVGRVGDVLPTRNLPALWSMGALGDALSTTATTFAARPSGGAAPGDGELTDVAVGRDGRIFAAGFLEVGSETRMLVVEYGQDRKLRQAPWPEEDSPSPRLGFEDVPLGKANGIAIDPDTRDVIVVGAREVAGREQWAAARFSADGQRRPGYAYLEQVRRGRLVDVAVVDGRVLALGIEAGVPVLAVLGEQAATVVTIDGEGPNSPVAMAVDSQKRLLVAGSNASRTAAQVARIDATTLAIDPGFGQQGVASLAVAVDGRPPVITVVDVGSDASGNVVLGLGLESVDFPAPDMTVARLTPGGLPDPSFGQAGLVIPPQDHARHARALAVAPGGLLVVGDGLRQGRTFHAAMLYLHRHDQLARAKVKYGTTERNVKRVIFQQPDPGDPELDQLFDAALVELDRPLGGGVADSPGQQRFGGVQPVDLVSLGHRKVTCYGYGRDDHGNAGTLRRGELVVDTLVDSHLLLEVDCPGRGAACGAQIEPGDSGGGCFVEDASRGWLQIGVTKSVEAAVSGRAWERVQTFVPLQQIDSWIDRVTGLHLHR